MTGTLRVLGAGDVQRMLPIADCIDAIEKAFRSAAVESFVGGVGVPGGKFHLKSAASLGDAPLFVAKINANFPENPRRGLPTIQGVLVLFEATTGRPLAIMDSSAVTIIRTAAASGVAARHLAPADARTVGIVGCGAQAIAQLAAMRAVRSIARVRAFDVDPDTLERFVSEARRGFDLDVEPVDRLDRCTKDADIVVTCTTSREPFLEPSHVRDGAFVAAVGVDSPQKSEIAPALMARAAVIVDDLDQCAVMGDLHHAIAAGAMGKSAVRGTLAEVVRDPARFAPDGRVVVFDSTGVPLEDVVAAALVHERAEREGIGQAVSLE